ncbi:hypothetical protein GUITHDRAFT_103126 [Guillardia theta CCMP2712]|uniref:Uncharacterized protein n=1 Tax=Guillardia theta (strain CCMP2712) TaxID=905079 RepID=L1JSC9_GUITC|nr:hypothetical protein GUITHDRAFT_103126 [Guillardia theta CCMP2712]EKX51209.1 hypothetical protein GUITHDRAFT_103126 [Guillardia theta CCMP2712]|eukprot:XP_005838189.1 hypothetical protein GUITHDRAFT_103126 [Guillardia theta CCMP2712]
MSIAPVRHVLVFFIVAALYKEAQATCFDDPTADACKDSSSFYNDTAINTDMQSLCTAMSYMTGCNIMNDCNSKKLTGVYCQPWSLISDVCDTSTGETMSMMKGCQANYNLLCKTGTKVTGCGTPVPGMIPTKTLTQRVYDYCQIQDPKPSGCNGCAANGMGCVNPLTTLSEMCKKDAKEQYCNELTKFCALHAKDTSSTSVFGVYCNFATRASMSYVLTVVMVFAGSWHASQLSW